MENLNYNKINEILKCITTTIERQVNEEYTQYKNKCLEDLDITLEMKRNSVVKNILDGLDISINSNEPYDLNPTILIKIEKKIYLKDSGGLYE